MFRGAKCILEGYSARPTASGGIGLEMNVSVWESATLPEGLTFTMRFALSATEAAEMAEALTAAAAKAPPA